MKWFVQVTVDTAATDEQAEAFTRSATSVFCDRVADTTEVRFYLHADTLAAAVAAAFQHVTTIADQVGLDGTPAAVTACTERVREDQLRAEIAG